MSTYTRAERAQKLKRSQIVTHTRLGYRKKVSKQLAKSSLQATRDLHIDWCHRDAQKFTRLFMLCLFGIKMRTDEERRSRADFGRVEEK